MPVGGYDGDPDACLTGIIAESNAGSDSRLTHERTARRDQW